MKRTLRLVLVLFAAVAVAAPTALAAERMWIGFHDDPSFRWVKNRSSRIESSAKEGATVMRLLVHWNRTAVTRPADGSDPFDPAYYFDDLDEAIRTAQRNDMEVVLTLHGTPRWANGSQTPNVMPRRVADFGDFARAIASRYSGRFDGYPFVRFWTVWNEPNLQLFLTPQFDSRGRSVAPRNYAKLYAAAYAGIKAGNPRALVAAGETSARGTDNPEGFRPVHSPGRFIEGVARANPRLRFDAWSHHPYPFTPSLKPSQKVRWPNITLGSLPTLQANLKRLFNRSGTIPIWVTEYGHETKPPDTLGISYAKQAAFLRQSIAIARSYPFVTMFVWFVYQDDPGQPWDSGLYTQAGGAKGASARGFSAAAKPLDARNAILPVPRGSAPLVTLYGRRFCVVDEPGENIAVAWRVPGRRLVETGVPLRPDCTIAVRLRGLTVARGRTYQVAFELHDIHGNKLKRQLTLRGV